MDIDATQLVLEAVFFGRLLVLLVLFFVLICIFVFDFPVFIVVAFCSFFLKPVLLAHDLVVGVRLEIKHLRKLEMLVDLVVGELVEVEDDPLQVHNQHVWSLGDQGPLAHIHLPLAAAALVVVDDLALDQLLKAIVHAFDVLHCEGQVVEVLEPILHLAALAAHELAAGLTPEDGMQEMLLGGAFESILNSIEYHVQELLGVLLFQSVRR